MLQHDAPESGLDHDSAFDLLSELERNTPDEIRQKRAHARLSIKAEVVIQPGNASQRLHFKVRGVTGDISPGGCRLLAPMPLRVGDIYRISVDRNVIDLPPLFARCVRCHLMQEDAFESGFTFFRSVSLPTQATAAKPQGLL